jgi:endoglucanase
MTKSLVPVPLSGAASMHISAEVDQNFHIHVGVPTMVNSVSGVEAGETLRLVFEQGSGGNQPVTFGGNFNQKPQTNMEPYSVSVLEFYASHPNWMQATQGTMAYSGQAPASPIPAPPPDPTPTPPPAPTIGPSYPFGSRKRLYSEGTTPSNLSAVNAATKAQYNRWKSDLRTGLNGRYPKFQGANRVVSEGIGYGMLIAVVMAGYDPEAQALFDDIYNVALTHPAKNTAQPTHGMGEQYLMNWRVEEGVDPDVSAGGWNALDGDMDIAMALLMADKQWGSGIGNKDYLGNARKTIDAMKRRNFSTTGVSLGMNHPNESRMSDQMLGHFQAFAAATGDSFWITAYERGLHHLSYSQSVLAPTTGLIPDFLEQTNTSTPVPSRDGWGDPGNPPGIFFWNSCRVPMRLAACQLTDPDARVRTVLIKLMDFLVVDTQGLLQNVAEGYHLDGRHYGSDNIYWNPASFVATSACGAMVDAKYQTALDTVTTYIVQHPSTVYYDTELELLSLFVLGGNWWSPV